jgi:hypothetical protein
MKARYFRHVTDGETFVATTICRSGKNPVELTHYQSKKAERKAYYTIEPWPEGNTDDHSWLTPVTKKEFTLHKRKVLALLAEKAKEE